MFIKKSQFFIEDIELDRDIDFVLANAKGFGGNNGTALIAQEEN